MAAIIGEDKAKSKQENKLAIDRREVPISKTCEATDTFGPVIPVRKIVLS